MHPRVNHNFLLAIIFFLIFFTHANSLFAGTASLSWSPPVENADGTTLSDLAGYTISYGTDSGNYIQSIDVGDVTSYEVQGLASGMTYYFSVTAYDHNRNESEYSDEGSKYIQDTAPFTYYCDSDSDGSINSSADGVCTGTGCEPSECETTPGSDCNDNNSDINPGASDSNCNGIDENCDGTPDNNYVASSTTCGTGACQSSGELVCSNGSLENTCTSGDPDGDDSDCNNIDDDCDGSIDNHYVTKISSCGTGECSSIGQIACIDGSELNSCSPRTPDEEVEISLEDGLDNDCDGMVDEGKSSKIDIKRVILAEDFSEGIPDFWTTEGSWNTENSCGRAVDQPFAAPYVIADSSCTEKGNSSLVTPPFDTNGCNTVKLSFSNQYYWYAGSMEVDISPDGGETWINYFHSHSDDNYPTPAWKDIALGAVTGSDKTLLNFKYSNESASGFWAIDNLWITCKFAGLDFSSHMNTPSSPESVLISNTGPESLSIDEMEIAGSDSSDFDLDLEDCLNKTLLPGESCMTDIVFTPGSGGTKNAYILIETDDPAIETSNIILTGTAKSTVPPVPTLRLNGLEGSATIKRGSQVILTASLDPKSYINENGDWWILMEYKNRWHYYGAQSGKWRRGSMLYQQGPLAGFESVEVLNTSNLRKGVYTFYFGVDTQMNGLQDLSNYYFDSITAHIE